MRCQNCGKETKGDDLFCPDCLKKLLGSEGSLTETSEQTTLEAVPTQEATKEKESMWFSFLRTVMKIPGVRVNRSAFLDKEFNKQLDATVLECVQAEGTSRAGVDLVIMDKVADGVIVAHSTMATATSFAAGLPGGLAMLGTVPADLAQYYFHLIVSAQKLAYIYGWPEFDDTSDDVFLSATTLLLGAMSGVAEATGAIKTVAAVVAREGLKKLTAPVFMFSSVAMVYIRLAPYLGGRLSLQLAKNIGKIVPIIGGVVSGGISLATFLPMAKRLKKTLREDLIKADE
ncbi:MAG: hypothetical protein LBU17_03080 [Treponema sp.]|jgi:hypothetical protein|nr:hypothetical protein [Treponema sp.]